MKLITGKKLQLNLAMLMISLVGLGISVFLVSQAVRLFSRATGVSANIIVDASVNQGSIQPIWQALAQGGEEKYPFGSVTQEIASLKPKYIRIDHIFDSYNVVKKQDNQLVFNWSELDTLVDEILATSSRPFFSLSYMPPDIAKEGNPTNQPVSWSDWSTLIKETVQHYSGKNQRNLNDAIYEVWNEPDLFGNWKIGQDKDYLLLYKHAVEGASAAQNVNNFKIGGPSITAPYAAWVEGFLGYLSQYRLRIDFYSWHRYSPNPEKFQEDINLVDTWLFKNAGYHLEKYLTEWGSDSENSPNHDGNFDAAHLVATVRLLIQRVDLAFVFEPKDGPDPGGKRYWGRWGLLTHEKAGPVEKKPKYYALQILNQVSGDRLSLEGEGTWVTGFATKKDRKIQIILVNFDPGSQHFETVPLTITNLENGNYSYKENFLVGVQKNSTEVINNNRLSKEIPLTPNNIVLVELEKV